MIKKALFPAAGYGTRFLPATKSVPKEMLPIVNKPLIHYGIKECMNAGIFEIGFVTGRNKRAIEDYLDFSPELEEKIKDSLKKANLLIKKYKNLNYILEEHFLQDVEFIPTRSTAAAAARAKDDPSSAAICSHIAAKIHKLPIHFQRIEDNLANRTRFLILSDFKNRPALQNKTSILARTQNRPGGLVRFLQTFEDEKVNITKIESRPVKESGFQAVFYLDFEGHIDDENVKRVLAANEGINDIKWLGSYVKAGE